MEHSAPKLGYRPALDGVRAFAVAAVIAGHYWLKPSGGFLGVDLFFVLSGFLITTLLMEEHARFRSFSLRRFYARRALRLWPALVTLLGVFAMLIVVGSVTGHHIAPTPASLGFKELLYGATYTTNIGLVFDRHSLFAPDLQHLWSLGVEEQFYLLWPAVLALLLASRRRSRLIPGLIVALIASILLIRIASVPAHPGALDPGLVTRFDSILIGCLTAVVFRSRAGLAAQRFAARWPCWLVAVGIMGVLVATSGPSAAYDGRTDLFCLAAAIVVFASLDRATIPGRLLAFAPFVFVGRISYALYLWHRPVQVWTSRAHLMQHFGHQAGLVIALGISFGLAIVSYRLIELPFLRRKWRLARVASHDQPLAEAGAVAGSHARRTAAADPSAEAPLQGSRAPGHDRRLETEGDQDSTPRIALEAAR